MLRHLTFCFCIFASSFAVAQEPETEEPAAVALREKSATTTLVDQSFFTDRSAQATVTFDEIVDQPDEWPSDADGISILDIEVQDEADASTATIRFLPRKTGLVTLPSLEFRNETTRFKTTPIQILVGEPKRSEEMSLTLTPKKLRVYVSEPLKVDLKWDCSLPAAALGSLRLNPDFFNAENIEVVVPRNTAPEESHLGLPIGGRRVIATRTLHPHNSSQLGTIDLPLFLRFSQPGTYTLDPVKLEVSKLAKPSTSFANYAAYFNNALFEPIDPEERFERLLATTSPVEIEVLALPGKNQGPDFSGLFTPTSAEVSITPQETEIGQLMGLEIKVTSTSPHGMISLPPLSNQSALRGRFLVDDEPQLLWDKDGTIFRTRIRALTTSVKAFPALSFQLFNPQTARYETLTTAPIPLTTKPSKGRDVIPLKTFPGATKTLITQPAGIWHNLQAKPMNDLFNTLHNFLNQAFWPLLMLGPAIFLILRAPAKRSRLRATDKTYRQRSEAYSRFKKISPSSPRKWQAFLDFMAITHGAGERTWTVGDSIQALQSNNATPEEIEEIKTMHAAADAHDFGSEKTTPTFGNLNRIAKRIALPLIFLATILTVKGDEWKDAETLFSQAQSAPAGSDKAAALYKNAALKFQAVAESKIRPGEAWNNAGNAWFQAGVIGRSIAAYREATTHRPFDPLLAENLAAARALTTNDMPPAPPWWQKFPENWLKSILIILNLLFWLTLLLSIRYPKRTVKITTAFLGILTIAALSLLVKNALNKQQEAVLISEAVTARKGPAFTYAPAFSAPLQEGLELTITDQRNDWLQVKLPDSRPCWLPADSVQWIIK